MRIVRLPLRLAALCGTLFACSAAPQQTFPPLLEAHASPTALVRPDGRIYVFDAVAGYRGVELYDPKNGSARLAPASLVADPVELPWFYAALLADNRILVCCAATCQVYLPGQDAWVGKQIAGGVNPLVTLADGRILPPGGPGDLRERVERGVFGRPCKPDRHAGVDDPAWPADRRGREAGRWQRSCDRWHVAYPDVWHTTGRSDRRPVRPRPDELETHLRDEEDHVEGEGGGARGREGDCH